MSKVTVEHNTAGDSRVAKGVPTIEEFDHANKEHQKDVRNMIDKFCELLKESSYKHDWTKTEEPYRSMFYSDLCNTINGKLDFMSGEWANIHYNEKERHHLSEHCPDDVNLFDVIEMMCDCIAAGMARNGEIYDLDLDKDILEKAFKNTCEIMKNQVIVVDKYGKSMNENLFLKNLSMERYGLNAIDVINHLSIMTHNSIEDSHK